MSQIKYCSYDILFQEIPNETSLGISITNCPCFCEGCHSNYLASDFGDLLNEESLSKMINKYDGEFTCVLFMGGDRFTKDVNRLCEFIKTNYEYKTAWYSGRDKLSPNVELNNLDYLKIGSYKKEAGGLDNPNTNQKFYIIKNGELKDETKIFWK